MRTKRYIGIEIRALDNQIKRLIDSKIQKSAFCRLTGSNGWIIDYIRKKSPKPVYQKDLEAEFNITRSTASKVLNLMEEKGFIVRESVPEDARLKKLVLTEEGLRLHWEKEALICQMNEELKGTLDPEETEQFLRTARKMKGNIRQILCRMGVLFDAEGAPSGCEISSCSRETDIQRSDRKECDRQ